MARVTFTRHGVHVRAIGLNWLLPPQAIELDGATRVSLSSGALGGADLAINSREWWLDLWFPVRPNVELIQRELEIPVRVFK